MPVCVPVLNSLNSSIREDTQFAGNTCTRVLVGPAAMHIDHVQVLWHSGLILPFSGDLEHFNRTKVLFAVCGLFIRSKDHCRSSSQELWLIASWWKQTILRVRVPVLPSYSTRLFLTIRIRRKSSTILRCWELWSCSHLHRWRDFSCAEPGAILLPSEQINYAKAKKNEARRRRITQLIITLPIVVPTLSLSDHSCVPIHCCKLFLLQLYPLLFR